jgi:hypothetical protein
VRQRVPQGQHSFHVLSHESRTLTLGWATTAIMAAAAVAMMLF